MDHFELHSEYKPTGDQPQAIEKLVKGFKEGNQFETLLGVTGSGKTFTMANVIQALNKPTLILAHNKTLAAQLYGEFKEFFPENAVEYFVSYYDYYQPEAYVPSSDTYIAKDSAINDEIDKLRLSATAAMSERKDVIIISSVSCIYGLGSPQEFQDMMISLRPGMTKDRDEVIRELIDIQYTRNEMDFHRSTFRVRGDTLEIFPANSSDTAIRVEFFGDEIDRISEIDVLTGEIKCQLAHIGIFPASHYVVPAEQIQKAAIAIEEELKERVDYFKSEDKLLEAQRISERTNFDIEMMKETGFCSGIENYSRIIERRAPGSAPKTLIDYFKDDFLLVIDESHVTIPQLKGMYRGDAARKDVLIDYGFRLPCAKDNRPLTDEEFWERVHQKIFISATPAEFERSISDQMVEQIIRPTGLVDPEISVRPTENQVDDLISEIQKITDKNERVLITTLTKRMAEDLTEYMNQMGVRVRYLHSEIQSLERVEILRDLRLGTFDVLVGVNLLREGLDIPEVSLVAIMDADKEGFLRSETSLIQTIGRAARNSTGKVIMYADKMTDSMNAAISETNRRRQIQMAYNLEHNIIPKTIKKPIENNLLQLVSSYRNLEDIVAEEMVEMNLSVKDIPKLIQKLEKDMHSAAKVLDFERAAQIRDQLKKLREMSKSKG